MPQNRLLVIGSQCESLTSLVFLPEVAERLHALLVQPGLGDCIGVTLESRPPGLLLDPTVAEAKAAIKGAVEEAAGAGATLILAYIGHGVFPDERTGDFYLMPTDATEPTSEGAIHFAEFIKDRIKLRRDHAGLLVLLDACSAGAGAWQSMERWVQSLRGNIGFELLTATDDRDTADAPLARGLIELMRTGDPEAGMRLHGRDLYRLLKDRNRPAQHVAYNAEDARLSLARNVTRDPGDVFWKDSPGRAQILKQTEYFQATSQLDALVEAARSHPLVVLTGDAGAGKSTLAAALGRPEVTSGRVPDRFVHAVAVLGLTTNQRSLADDLERQLRRSLPGFAEAVAEFERSVTLPEREKLDFLPRMVLRPLAYLALVPEIRVVLDGFDQLPDVTREAVGKLLAARPGPLRLIIAMRPDTPGCPPGHTIHLGPTLRDDIDHYLLTRRVPDAARRAILDRAGNHWLVAKLLADAVVANPAIDLSRLPRTVEEAYATLLDQAGAADAWNGTFRPVLGPLAVAGSGPILPLSLLVHASKTLGGAGSVEDIRALLARLRGLVVRLDAGTPGEHVGLFHATFADYLLGPSAASVGYRLDAQEAHRAMTQAITALAPMDKHDRDDAFHRYAFVREADHLWTVGDTEQTLECLRNRIGVDPRVNLERWGQWLSRFRDQLGQDHEYVLILRSWIAHWIGEAGDSREAQRMFAEVLMAEERVLGRDHRETLRTRSNVAEWTGKSGDVAGALRMFTALLAEQEIVLGRDHSDTLLTRSNIASWTGESGDAPEALRLLIQVLPDQIRVLGRNHPDTLRTFNNVAVMGGLAGDGTGAMRMLTELLKEQKRVLGRDHPDTLGSRYNIAEFTGKLGDAPTAMQMFTELLTDRERVLGRDHPHTITTLRQLAFWSIKCGRREEGTRLLRDAITRVETVLRALRPG